MHLKIKIDHPYTIDWSSNIGVRCQRYVAKGGPHHAAYHDADTAGKVQSRKDWAEQKRMLLSSRPESSRSYRSVDATRGTYACCGKLAEHFGIHYSRKRAGALAKKCAVRCCLMGGRWTSREPLTSELEFLVVERAHVAEMFQSAETSATVPPNKAQGVGLTTSAPDPVPVPQRGLRPLRVILKRAERPAQRPKKNQRRKHNYKAHPTKRPNSVIW